MTETVHHHRPTLKQASSIKNKPFKSKHASKGSLKEAAKGRTPHQSPKANHTANAAAQLRINRRNNAKQAQLKRRQSLVSATRIFSGTDGAPRVVAIVPLTEDVKARDVSAKLAQAIDGAVEEDEASGLQKLRADRFKTSLQFIPLPYRQLYAILDACKVADYVIFVLSPDVEVDKWGDTLLRTLQAQGLPEVVTVVSSNQPMDPKEKSGIMKSLLSFIQYFVPSQSRVFDMHHGADTLNTVRALCEGKPSDVKWRDGRSYILGEKVDWVDGALSVIGVVRGAHLSANRLIHIPNYGDFQIDKIVSAPLPKHTKHGGGMDVEPQLLAEPDASSADSLVSSNDPDDMANEQTWPTEEEMRGASNGNGHPDAVPDAKTGTTPKAVRKVPKGTSEYQAAWIIDESDEEDAEGSGEGEGGEHGEVEMEEVEEMEEIPATEGTEMDVDDKRSVAFQDLDEAEEARQLQSWRDRKREEEDDTQFPDEIDTPLDVPARTRFQRYRGLRSFRTSPWDPYENLPRDYARIFQFEDFKRTERAVKRRAEEEGGVEPGTRVTVYLKDVPNEAARVIPGRPFTVFSLLQHEHKKTVLNFTLQRNTEYDGSVRSKDPLILCVGPRRIRVNPIYSQHTRGGGKGPNNVHKFERYLRHGVTNVATIYGPVVYGKQPCTLLRETNDPQAPELVAMGSFLHPDTTRIIAKRIILTGHPFKIHKKTATIRYMFFNPEDIAYLKPIQLHTKYGRTGHIKESLGTHGYYKAHFDGPISQMDTVCMSLYKRVYPKWGETWKEGESAPARNQDDAMDE
ncbi:ribosome biogenesis protein tsr1 [Dichomitus squalens LYAD-421 SS1]|uniref:ribosome biogenesis protein tsr1 n=1 Tax=Dichomitus squalens (strain LYAD-421) TaxID=732165 RepID=UPI00044145AE|nr:ribosome biogenesis protein tsr1 [Dichomitus squalens LYAD-421 SS1]EJF65420.1 ribosome biogenesis protein tsr1 [Dichomitus squalens LYAD-421 SS1]